jgi:FHS family L-fucose permease-like MFS transporter
VLIFVACVVIFIYGMLASLLGTIVPSLGTILSLSNTQIGYLALSQGLGLAGTSVVAGAFMDAKGKKVGILIGLLASLIGLGILSHPINLQLSILAMVILGCGGSLVIVGSNALANDVPDARRAVMINFLNIFAGLGGFATPFIAGNLLGADAVKSAYCGCAISLFALLITIFTPMPHHATEEGRKKESGSIFGSGTLYVLASITFFYTACEFGIWNWFPKFLMNSGMPSSRALNLLSFGFASGLLVGRIVATKLLTKVSPYYVTLVCAALMGISTFTVLKAASSPSSEPLIFFAGLVMAPIFPTTIAIVGRLFKQKAATAIGFAITCGFSGLVVSSPVIGWLAGSDPQGIGRGLLILPALSAAIVLIMLVFRERLTTPIQ